MTSPTKQLGSPEGRQGRLVPEWVERVSRVSWAFLGFAGAATVVVLGVAALREIVIPLMLASAVAVAFVPLVGWLSRRGVPRSLGALLVMISIAGIVVASVVLVVAAVVDQADELKERFDQAVVEIEDLVDQANTNELVESVRDGASEAAPTVRDGAASQVGTFLDSAAGFASGLVLGLVLLYYLLKDGPDIVTWAAKRRTPEATAQTERILSDAREAGLEPPSERDWSERLAISREHLQDLLAHLKREGRLVRTPGDLWFDAGAVAALRERIVAHFADRDRLDTPAYKALIGTTRRTAVPLMEYFDDEHLTTRSGDARVLRSK